MFFTRLVIELVVVGFSAAGERYSRVVQQRNLFSELLRITDHMKAFVSQRVSGEEELCSRLEQAEASLSAARRASEESVEALKRS